MNIKILNYECTDNIFYIVKKHDTIENIAKRFCINADYIKANNNFNDLYEGLVLFFPCTNFKVHIVKPFETIEEIAKNCNESVDKIMQKNSLLDRTIFVGQKLYL